MIILDYYSLDLQIAKEPEGSHSMYRASILENRGTKATRSFDLIHDLKLIQVLNRIEKKAVVPHPQPDETIHIEFGKMLYNAVFSGELEEYFNKRFNEAQEENYGLRVSLQFSEDVPEIAALPWEYLHDGEDFLVTKRSVLLSRLPTGIKKIKSKPLNSVLRMLVVISSPEDPRISLLNTEKEQEIILEALDKLQKEQKIKVDFTEDATFENVQNYLNEQNYHIVHFTGHGVSRNGKGHLIFETEDRKARFIDNKTLANLFSDNIKLVVLSSCESARGSNKEAFGDLASMLSKSRIPAVVAMQYSILDDVATKFAYIFYKTIASGKPVDIALKEARIAMKNSEKSNGFDFATPVMYLSDFNCIRTGKIKSKRAESEFKPMMLQDLQLMKTGFVARKRELHILEKGFKSSVKRAAIIHGLGGLGKTVLATRLALKMNEYFDGVFGMKCTSTTRPEDILNRINSFLMMKGRYELNQIINQQIPFEYKTSLLVNILNNLRFLIILDNFEHCLDEDRKDIESPELKAFIQSLLNNTISNTKFIITTRYDFDPMEGRLSESIEHISLPELHFPQTNWLMNNYTELADLDIHKKKQIYDVIGGHPWAIGQFAKLASTQDVDSLLFDLKLLKKEFTEFTLMEKSFSKLDSEAKRLLLYASIYDEAVPIEALSWIIGDKKDESPFIGEPLQKLIQWNLISREQEYNQTVYVEHTIIRDFAKDKLKEEEFDGKKLLLRAAKYYENLVTQDRSVWSLLKARDYYLQARKWKNASNIVEGVIDYLIMWGYIELSMNLLNESIIKSSGDSKTNFEYIHATILFRLGDLDSSFKIFNDLRCKYDGKDKCKLALVLLHIGTIYYVQGNTKEAMKMYTQSLKISRSIKYKSGIAGVLKQLGIVYYHEGKLEKAMKMYNQSLIIFEELEDKRSTAAALHQIGNIYFKQENLNKAFEFYNDSLNLNKELGDRSGIAGALHAIGNIHYEEGRLEEAVEMYNQSLKISDELGDKMGIATITRQLGDIHFDQNNLDEAMKMYNKSLRISEETGNKSEIAYTSYRRGIIYSCRGNNILAFENLLTAYDILNELKYSDNKLVTEGLCQFLEILKEQMEAMKDKCVVMTVKEFMSRFEEDKCEQDDT